MFNAISLDGTDVRQQVDVICGKDKRRAVFLQLIGIVTAEGTSLKLGLTS
jgi:hypothetical protein